MSKYYKFRYSSGFAGARKDKVIKFDDDVSLDEVNEAFEDWYKEQRRDHGDFKEISEEEAENLGIDIDYGD